MENNDQYISAQHVELVEDASRYVYLVPLIPGKNLMDVCGN